MLRSLVTGVVLSLASLGAQASLLGRAPATQGGTDYQAYYDDVLNITWLADANLAATNTFGVTGIAAIPPAAPATGSTMTWATANNWIAAMNAATYLGVNAWRLPTVDPLNGSTFTGLFGPTSEKYSGGSDYGYNISAPGTPYAGSTASEMSHLFYTTLGNVGQYSTSGQQTYCWQSDVTPCLAESGPFVNLRTDNYYWSGSVLREADPDSYWTFNFASGMQPAFPDGYTFAAWAVHDGDPFAPVPLPAAVWLFGSALGVMGVMRRKIGS